eukprot:SAG11_NODE_1284_length_5305_cov_1.528621_3_plen_149_part_00
MSSRRPEHEGTPSSQDVQTLCPACESVLRKPPLGSTRQECAQYMFTPKFRSPASQTQTKVFHPCISRKSGGEASATERTAELMSVGHNQSSCASAHEWSARERHGATHMQGRARRPSHTPRLQKAGRPAEHSGVAGRRSQADDRVTEL